MLSDISRSSPLSTAAIGMAGTLGAFVSAGFGAYISAKPMAIPFALVGGALGLHLGEKCLSNSAKEDENANVIGLQEFCQVRSDILHVVKSYLVGGGFFLLANAQLNNNLPEIEFDALGSSFDFHSVGLSLASISIAVWFLSEAHFQAQKLNCLKEDSLFKRDYVLSALATGAIGAAGIAAGGFLGLNQDSAELTPGLAMTGGFLGLQLGERYLGKYLKKVTEPNGFARYGKFYNDHYKVLNVAKHGLMAAALGLFYQMSSTENWAKKYSSLPVVPSLSNVLYPAAVIFSIYAIARAFTTSLAMDNTVRRWVVNDREVRVFKESGELKLEVADLETKSIHEQVIVRDNSRTMQEYIDHYRQSELVLEEDGGFTFAKPLLQKHLIKTVDNSRPRGRDSLDPVQKCAVFMGAYKVKYIINSLRNFLIQEPCAGSICGSSLSKPEKDLKAGYWGIVTLLKGREKMIWQIFLKKTGKAKQISLSDMTLKEFPNWFSAAPILDEKSSREYENFLSQSEYVSSEECLKFLKNYHCNVINKGWGVEDKFVVELSPVVRSGNSYFNKYIQLSEANWIVALICTNGSNPLGGMHGAIVIEGIKDGRYFMQLAHLHQRKRLKGESQTDNRGIISVRMLENPGELIYTERSRCWQTKNWKVELMLENIREQAKNPPILIFTGSKSFWAKEGEDSCIRWALEKLEMLGIVFPPSVLDKFATITNLYTTIQNPNI